MVARNVSKDSWSRCEDPSMLYDSVRNPSTISKPKINKVTGSSSTDTIESTQHKLKREMLDRFQNKGLELPHESYVAVVQVGKYVFLAVMLPVYLCCYGIPRWLIVNSFHLADGIKNQTITVGRFIVETAKRVADIMKGLLEQLIGDALRLSRDRARNFWKRVSSKLSKFAKNFSDVAGKIATHLKKVQVSFKQFSAKVYGKAHQNSQKTNQWVVKHSKKFAKKVEVTLLKWGKIVDKRLLTPFIQFFLPAFKLVGHILQAFGGRVSLISKKIKGHFESISKPILKYFRKKINKSLKAFKRYTAPVRQWLSEKKKVVQGFVKEKILKPINKLVEKIRQKVNFVLKPFFKLFQKLYSFLPKHVKSALTFVWKKSTRQVKKKNDEQKERYSNFKKSTKSMVLNVLTGLKTIFQFTMKMIVKLKERIFATLLLIKKIALWLGDILKTLPYKIKSMLLILFKILAIIISRVAFAGHLLIALIWATSVYGFMVVHEMTEPRKQEL